MHRDIRDKPSISHPDVVALNFVRGASPYRFRRHHRQGLRSHIMEILSAADVERERRGERVDGVMRFPRALPRHMFRIFRSRMPSLDAVLDEIQRVKIVERYLAPDFMARSTECVVDYEGPDGRDLLLCGFQEYVAGEILDPWTLLEASDLLPTLHQALCRREDRSTPALTAWTAAVRQKGEVFIGNIKRMIIEAGHIPDLAGAGNLIITENGAIRLVDINNISRVVFDASVYLDEKGYPVADKSIEALSLIEKKVLGRSLESTDPVYGHFLAPARHERVRADEAGFWQKQATG